MRYQLTLFEEFELERDTPSAVASEIEVIYRPRLKPSQLPRCDTSAELFKLFWNAWDYGRMNYQENFNIIFLNHANRALGFYALFKGAMTSVTLDHRLIFSAALKCNACKIALAHNHPSGDLRPSEADKHCTRRIKDIGTLLEIKIIDHLIINSEGHYYSFADEGLI